MAHEINSARDIAFVGATPWHGMGSKLLPGQPIDVWAKAANLDWTAVRVPALADVNGLPVETGAFFNIRSDNHMLLGTQTHSDRREEVQPAQILDFLNRYIGVDDRFQLDVAGNIQGGRTIWATAKFNGDFSVGGDAHQAYLLARTSYDGTSATILQMTTVRVVCRNTMNAAYGDKRALVSVRHTVTFNAATAAKQLAAMAQSVDTYRKIGDAMAQVEMSYREVSDLFKHLLDIPLDAKKEDISTRKMNTFQAMRDAFTVTVQERNEVGRGTSDAFTALQAVTRYVDHERTVRGDEGTAEAEKRFTSAQFGSGETFKGKAMAMLLPRVKDKVLIAA